MRRVWQSAMIGLARMERLKRAVQSWRATSALAERYVAGRDASDAIRRAEALRADLGLRVSAFYLGEYVTDPDVIAETVTRKREVAEMLARTGLDVHVSVDSTQIGQIVDARDTMENATAIAEAMRGALAGRERPGHLDALMFDMEDATVIDDTIALHDTLQDKGYPVALTLQAYLKRTAADLGRQVARGGRVRLVKGAFIAGDDIAYASNTDIKANYRRLIAIMFSKQARDGGFYPIVATHDDRLHDYALELARTNAWPKDAFEFEMLLGVRGDVAKRLASDGYRVRLYTPFGKDWWPYAVRRIGENPANAMLLARSLIS